VGSVFYIVYVDASGDPGKYEHAKKNTRHYVLVGLMIPAEQRVNMDDEIRQTLLEYFHEEDLPKEIKGREIVWCRKEFAHLKKKEKRELLIRLLNLLKGHSTICYAIVVDKAAYWEKYKDASPASLRRWSMHMLLDRVDRALERRDSLGAMVYDYEGKKDTAYRKLLEELKREGSIYWPHPDRRRRICRLVDTIYFISSELTFGLQMADIVAYIIRASYENPEKAEYLYPLVEEILDKDPETGEYHNWGLKKIP